MSDQEKYRLTRPLSAHDKFETLRDFVEAEFVKGVCAADALIAVRKKAAELGITPRIAPGVEKRPRFRLVAER